MNDDIWSKDAIKAALRDRLPDFENVPDMMEKDPALQRQFIAGIHVARCMECQRKMQVIWDEIYIHSLENKK